MENLLFGAKEGTGSIGSFRSAELPGTSIWQRAQELDNSRTSIFSRKKNPRVIVEKQMQPHRVVTGGIEDHSSKKSVEQTIVVNGARYRYIIIQFFVPKLQDMYVVSISHTAREIINYCMNRFLFW
ncbi:hypothetical protein CEXT_541981 [Caerostris extrusa]|uniref:Uncharacterized protein n=1 Tax=Caerostris extrusa TaxID=172846 RepID=A0AAV4NJ41_CAEEX|nr:hypothetical protein CEXT_541981 [Caerostris extrusa]